MTPEQAALYRRIAQALEQRGVEPKLLDAGTVVPSPEVCFWRLALAWKGVSVWQHEEGEWEAHGNGDAYGNPSYVQGTDPLDALLNAVAASLSLELEKAEAQP